jgi:hypothetical protein
MNPAATAIVNVIDIHRFRLPSEYARNGAESMLIGETTINPNTGCQSAHFAT